MILSLAAVWVLLSLAGNILRLFSLRLLCRGTYLSLISEPPTPADVITPANSSFPTLSP